MNRTQQIHELVVTLRELTTACGKVAPIAQVVPINTSKDVRGAMNFVAAYDKAVALLRTYDCAPDSPRSDKTPGDTNA